MLLLNEGRFGSYLGRTGAERVPRVQGVGHSKCVEKKPIETGSPDTQGRGHCRMYCRGENGLQLPQSRFSCGSFRQAGWWIVCWLRSGCQRFVKVYFVVVECLWRGWRLSCTYRHTSGMWTSRLDRLLLQRILTYHSHNYWGRTKRWPRTLPPPHLTPEQPSCRVSRPNSYSVPSGIESPYKHIVECQDCACDGLNGLVFSTPFTAVRQILEERGQLATHHSNSTLGQTVLQR